MILRERVGADTVQAADKLGEVAKPVPTPESLPDPGDTSLDINHSQPSPEPDINDIQRDDRETSYIHLAGPTGDFAVPTLSELGLKPATTQHRGGETVALRALDDIISNTTYTATFSKPDTAPTAFDPQSTTLLSPHHHFGSLSVRHFYWQVMDVLSKNKGKQSTIPTNLIGQLLFRYAFEFTLACFVPKLEPQDIVRKRNLAPIPMICFSNPGIRTIMGDTNSEL